MQALEARLLETGDFVACEALTNYCKLVITNKNKTPQQLLGQTQKHHILPRSWYKMNNIAVDNSNENLVRLLVSDHVKAHLFLFQAAATPDVRSKNAAAVRYMCDLFSEELIDEHADELNQINQEVKRAKSKILAERRAAGLNERRRAVECIETGQVFNTIKDAEETMHVFIHAVLSGKQSHAGGYHFKYVGEEPPEFKPKVVRFTHDEIAILERDYYKLGTKIPQLLERHTVDAIKCKANELGLHAKDGGSRKVMCIETGEIFKNASSTGVSRSAIFRSLRNSASTAGGYHWRYLDDEQPEDLRRAYTEENLGRRLNNRWLDNELTILRIKYSQIGPDIPELLEYHTRHAIIIKAKELNLSYDFIPATKAVRCVETAEIFESAESAALSCGAQRSNIYKAIRTGGKSFGYHWEYVI